MCDTARRRRSTGPVSRLPSRLRARLEAHSAANVTSLEAIDDAILLLSLDEADVGTTGGAEPRGEQLLKAERLALCGGARPAPRGLDKSFSRGGTADGVAEPKNRRVEIQVGGF